MDRPSFLEGGEQARLIPVAADSNREARAASILLATLLAVPPFAKLMLGQLGQRIGSRAALDCYTEVVFCRNGGAEDGCRPDGLILLDGGRGRQWFRLVEARIGTAPALGGTGAGRGMAAFRGGRREADLRSYYRDFVSGLNCCLKKSASRLGRSTGCTCGRDLWEMQRGCFCPPRQKD
ncbi:hypothetical protein [Aquibaculum sediminis]|uniref:hypothetical protein n=1 Tax=Aquibaculum sediminis TaxID=3231907 RepID=UPI003454BC2A